MTLSFPTQAQRLTVAADNILKSAAPAKLDWKPVDTDTLPHEFAVLYANYKQAQAQAAALREAFEDAICGPLAKMLNAKPGHLPKNSYVNQAVSSDRLPAR